MLTNLCSSKCCLRAVEWVEVRLRDVSKQSVLFFVVGLILTACAGNPGMEAPLWASNLQKTESKKVEYLSQSMAGEWVINEELSDNPQEVILRTYKRSDYYKRGPVSRDDRGKPSMMGGKRNSRQSHESKFVERIAKDPRLRSLFARNLKISFSEDRLGYSYATGETNIYPVTGESVSLDDNINIAFGEWEYGKFVIEQNGPSGSIIEYWTLSPDRQQLHVGILIQANAFSESISINRLFDRILDSDTE